MSQSIYDKVRWTIFDNICLELNLWTRSQGTVEVLSPGTINQRRDKEAKLKLYSIQGV